MRHVEVEGIGQRIAHVEASSLPSMHRIKTARRT